MIRNSGGAPIGVAILHVGTSLPRQHKAQRLQDAADFAWFEDRRPRHLLRGNRNVLRAHKLGIQIRLAVLKYHLDHLMQVALQLVESLPL